MRLPAKSPSELTAAEHSLYESMKMGIAAKYSGFKVMDDDGRLLGPWGVWLHDPEIGTAIWALSQSMTAARRIPDRARQVAILVVGGKMQAGYEIYAHGSIARERYSMSDERIAALAAGEKPEDLDAEEAAAFDVAAALLAGGPLPAPLYHHAIATFGQQGANELFYLVGYYMLVATSLNAFDVKVPGEPRRV